VQERLQSYYNIAKENWNKIERKRKVQLIATAVLVVIALGVIVFWLTRPNMIELVNVNDPIQRTRITSVLSNEGIRNRSRNGNIYVELNNFERAMVILHESDGVLRGTENFSFNNFLDAMGMGTTSLTQRASLNQTKQSALNRIIERFDGIITADVVLSIPDPSSIFGRATETAKASVAVVTSRRLTNKDGRAIALAVANSERLLSIENVTVIDNEFNVLHSADTDYTLESQLGHQQSYRAVFNSEVERMVRSSFKYFDNMSLYTNFVFNWDKIYENVLRYHLPDDADEIGFMEYTHFIKESTEGTNNQGIPGMPGNDQMEYLVGEGATNRTRYEEATQKFLYDVFVTDITRAMGLLIPEQSGMTATFFKTVTHCEVSLRADGTLNDEMSWADYKRQYPEAVPFTEEEVLVYRGIANDIANVQGLSHFNITAFYINEFIPAPEPQGLNWALITILALLFLFIGALAFSVIKRAQPEEIIEIDEPLTVEDMLASNKLDEEKEDLIEAERLRAIQYGGDSEAKKMIEKFVDEKPEAVAGLLRNWLNEDWE
jgi:flagellar M-ring protein FliF